MTSSLTSMAKGRLKRTYHSVKDALDKFGDDNIGGLAAMQAFYLLFAVLASILLMVFVAGQLFNSPSIVNATLDEFGRIFPTLGEQDLKSAIESVRHNASRLGLIAAIGLLWTGSSFWTCIDTAMAKIYRVPRRSFLRKRLTGFAVAIVLVIFICLAIFLITYTSIESVIHELPFGLSDIPLVLLLIPLIATWIIASLMLFAIYSLGPNTKVNWHEIWPGTIVGATLVTLLTLLFPLYTTLFDVNKYGAVFGLIALTLTWLYLHSLFIMIGAEVNARRHIENRDTEVFRACP